MTEIGRSILAAMNAHGSTVAAARTAAIALAAEREQATNAAGVSDLSTGLTPAAPQPESERAA